MGREHFVTCGQMKILERRADEDGLSYYQMMENAGTRAAEVIMETVDYRSIITRAGSVGDTGAGTSGKDAAVAPVKGAGNSAKPAYTGKPDIPMAAAGDNSGITDAKVAETAPAGTLLDKVIGEAGAAGAMKDKPAYIMTKGSNGFVSRVDKRSLQKKVLIFCGKGNNGGDGFVVARLLHDEDYAVKVVLVDGPPQTPDSITNFELLKERGISIADMVENDRALLELKEIPDVIVDAIYGTGFRGKLSGNGLRAAIYINSFSVNSGNLPAHKDTMVVAIDIPSGLGGDLTDEKELETRSVSAHCTVTFHAKKPVHLQKFAAPYCGKIVVADIGIDEERLWKVEVW